MSDLLLARKVFCEGGQPAGSGIRAAILTDGSLRAWTEASATLTTPVAGNDFVDVYLPSRQDLFKNIALRSNGTIATWGSASGASAVPSGFVNLVAIAGSDYYILGLKTDGTVVEWGYGGATGYSPAGLIAKSIAVGYAVGEGGAPFVAVAVRANGTVVVWGSSSINLYGQLNTPTVLQNAATANVDSVAAINATCFALRHGQPLIAWGQHAGAVRTTPATKLTEEGWAMKADGTWFYALSSIAILEPSTAFTDVGGGYGVTTSGRLKALLDGFSIPVEFSTAPIITGGQSFTGKVGVSFSETLLLSDEIDRPATSFSVMTALPAGLSLNTATGEITGTPTVYGSFSAGMRATGPGGYGTTVAVGFTITAGTPSIVTGQSIPGRVGGSFSRTPLYNGLTQSGVWWENRPVTGWSATGLPGWASINATTGVITGIPEDAGDVTVAVTVTGPGGSDTENVTLAIGVGIPITTSGQSFTGKFGEAFTATISTEDASDRPTTSFYAATSLPLGLTLNTSTGEITGIPIVVGSFNVSIRPTGPGGVGTAATVAFTITPGTPILDAGQTISFMVGVARPLYGINKLATSGGGNGTHRPVTGWSATGLPAWASIDDTTGEITCSAPTTTGSIIVSVTATGPGGTDTENATFLTYFGVPVVTSGQTFSGQVGEELSETVLLTDETNRPATSWSASGLPSGLVIGAGGVVSGTPRVSGTFTATITPNSTVGSGYPTTISLTVAAGIPYLATGRFLVGYKSNLFTKTPELKYGSASPATSWSATGFPAWASINADTGAITGMPTTTGDTSVSITATNAIGSDTQTVTISISEYSTPVGVVGGNWAEFRAIAKAGVAVRRAAWPITKTLIYKSGPGTVRSVAMLVQSGVVTVVKNTDFTQADYVASDWRRA